MCTCVYDCTVILQVSLHEALANTAAGQLSADKNAAEQAVMDLLKQAKAMTQRKIDLCEQRHQQKQMLPQSLGSSGTDGPATQNNAQASVLTVRESVKRNDVQLAACKELVLAFRATQDARAQLQKCLDKEQALMQELHDPLQRAITNSKQLIGSIAAHLQNSDPAREKQHAEMLIRCWITLRIYPILPDLLLDSKTVSVCKWTSTCCTRMFATTNTTIAAM